MRLNSINVSRRAVLAGLGTGLGAALLPGRLWAQDGQRVALLMVGSISDGGWNQLAFEGLADLKAKGFGTAYVENVTQARIPEVVRGYADDTQQVERVVEAYAVVGAAIARNTIIPYSLNVAEQARRLTAVINGHVKSIEFIVADKTITIEQPITEEKPNDRTYALGTVTGQVDTLMRRGYTFTIYELIFDRAVTCYLQPEQEDLMRNAWGKIATVTGDVCREQFCV